MTLLCCLLYTFGTKIMSQFIPANRLRFWAVEVHAGNQSTSNNMQSTWNRVTLSNLKLGIISTSFLLYITFFRAWAFALLVQFLICNAINSSSSIHKHWSTGVKEQPAWGGNEKEAAVVWHLQCVCVPTLCSKSPRYTWNTCPTCLLCNHQLNKRQKCDANLTPLSNSS